MKGPWENLYDRIKDRRYGTLFLFVFLGVIGPLIVLSRLEKRSLVFVLPGIGLVVAAWITASVRRTLAGRRHRLRFPQLSGDELRVARSKLMKERDRKSL